MRKSIYFFLLALAALVILWRVGTGSSRQTENVSQAESETKETEAGENEETVERTAEVMRIRVEADGKEIIFELNDSQAAEDLYNQLPMTLENEDFSDNEKTFYPPQKLDVSDAPFTDGSIGTLAYYEPWGDVVLFTEATNRTARFIPWDCGFRSGIHFGNFR